MLTETSSEAPVAVPLMVERAEVTVESPEVMVLITVRTAPEPVAVAETSPEAPVVI